METMTNRIAVCPKKKKKKNSVSGTCWSVRGILVFVSFFFLFCFGDNLIISIIIITVLYKVMKHHLSQPCRYLYDRRVDYPV